MNNIYRKKYFVILVHLAQGTNLPIDATPILLGAKTHDGHKRKLPNE